MKIKLNRSIIILFFVLHLSSCLKDETNMNFTNVILPDSVIIVNVTDPESLNPKRVKYTEAGANFAGSFESLSGVELRLEANVFYEGPYNIEYEWIADGGVISTDKVLSYIPIKDITIRLNVKRGDERAGSDYRINLIVTHEFASGLYVMGKEGGRTVLDFFRYSTEEIESDDTGKPGVYKLPQYTENSDIFTLYNEHDLPCTDPIGMQWIKSKHVTTYGYGIQLLDKDYRKSVTIMASTIKENARLADEWIGVPEDFRIKSMSNVYYTSILLSESGNMYLRTNYDYGTPNTGRFSSSPLGFNDPLDNPDMGWQKIDATLHCMTKIGDTKSLIYEKNKKRFLALVLAVDTWDGDTYPDKIEVMKLPTKSTGANGIDLNNFDKEIMFTFPDGGALLDNTNIDIIYKEGDKLRIQAQKLDYSTYLGADYKIVYNSELSPLLTSLLKTEGVYVTKDKDSGRKGELYIAAGKKLYISNMTGTVMEELATFDTDLVFFQKLSPWTTSTATEANYFSGKVAALAFANGDLKIIKFYKDPSKPGQILQKVLAEKNYDGGFVDAKFIYSNVIMGY